MRTRKIVTAAAAAAALALGAAGGAAAVTAHPASHGTQWGAPRGEGWTRAHQAMYFDHGTTVKAHLAMYFDHKTGGGSIVGD